MEQATVKKLIQAFGLKPERVLPTEKGYRNSSHPVTLINGQTANLVLYKNEPGILSLIQQANNVSDFLYQQGFPSRHTIDPRILSINNSRYCSLYSYLPGATIPWEAYTMDHLKELGRVMGLMHQTLQKYPADQLSSVAEISQQLLRRMEDYFSREGVKRAIEVKLGLKLGSRSTMRLRQVLQRYEALRPQQALHMDFVRGNILFAEATISGVLDFEKVARGHRAFDLARTLAFLLVDCKYKAAEKIRKYFLVSGYQKRGGCSLPDQGLEDLVDFFLLHDFYKFLKHNPYESLQQNEHYARTVELLLERGIVAKST